MLAKSAVFLPLFLGTSKNTRVPSGGSGENSFGTIGAGGSFGFADLEAQVGFAYAPNKMGFHIGDDPREKSLRDAVCSCL